MHLTSIKVSGAPKHANRTVAPRHIDNCATPPQTLPLNKGARSALVPKIIAAAPGGLGTVPFPEDVCWQIVLAIFDSWDFAAHYVPRDLAARGGEQHPLLSVARSPYR